MQFFQVFSESSALCRPKAFRTPRTWVWVLLLMFILSPWSLARGDDQRPGSNAAAAGPPVTPAPASPAPDTTPPADTPSDPPVSAAPAQGEEIHSSDVPRKGDSSMPATSPRDTSGAGGDLAGKGGDLKMEDIVVTPPQPKKRARKKPQIEKPTDMDLPGPTEAPTASQDLQDGPAESAGAKALVDEVVKAGGPDSGGQGGSPGPSEPISTGPRSAAIAPEGHLTGDVRSDLTPTFHTVIERGQFAGKMQDLADVIQKEVGVSVRQSGGLGSFSEVSLRGSSSDQVMIYMDGILLNDASGGGVDLSNISLSDVESIEIYRGMTPAEFGKASVGGVINIRTLRAKKGTKASVGGGWGSFYTKKVFGYLNYKPGQWDVLTSAEYQGSENDFEFLNRKGTDWNTRDDVWEKRKNAQFGQYNLLGKTGYDISDDFRVDLVGQYFNKSQGLATWMNNDSQASLDTERLITTVKMTRNNLSPLKLNTTWRIYYNWKRELYDDRDGAIGLGSQINQYITKRKGTDFFIEWPTTYNILSLNAEYYQEGYEPRDLLGTDESRDNDRSFFSAALQDAIVLFDQRIVVTPTMRYTHIHDQINAGSNLYGITYAEESTKEQYWSPQIGAKVKPFSWLTLKANLGRYVREPSFFEMFGDRGFFLGNSDLLAETGTNYDVGMDFDWDTHWEWISRIKFEIAYFHSQVDDLITRIYDARGVGQSVNISEAEISGIEASAQVDFLKFFTLSGNMTQQEPLNKSQIEAFDGKILPGRYQDSYLVRLEARYKNAKVFGEWQREEGRYYDTANLVEATPKEEINAGVSYLFHNVLFSLEGKNLANREFEDYHRYPLPGRAFYFTVKYDY